MDLPLPAFEDALRPFAHPLLFITVSGAHLYGFPSADSDFDLRGCHLLPGAAFWGLDAPRETEEVKTETEAGLVELVTHDLTKFVRLLLRRNGYVLEQLTSPLVVRSSPVHTALLEHVPGILTRRHYHHYRGFYHNERREYDRSEPRSVKKLLYCYRVLMSGIVLLREAVVEANLRELNRRFEVPVVEELVAMKASGERVGLPPDSQYTSALEGLEAELDRALAESSLPEAPPARQELARLVVRVRAEAWGGGGC